MLGLSLLNDSFVESLYVSDKWVDKISDSISLLEICELSVVSFGRLEIGNSLLNFVISL